MDEWILLTYFSVTQESTCIVPRMDEQMNGWMILTHILQCDTRINMYSSTLNGWINEGMDDLNTHTSVWHKNQHVK
jgi:hypothetical protein